MLYNEVRQAWLHDMKFRIMASDLYARILKKWPIDELHPSAADHPAMLAMDRAYIALEDIFSLRGRGPILITSAYEEVCRHALGEYPPKGVLGE